MIIIQRQAGAELCQAQEKLSRAVLDYKFVNFDPANLFFLGGGDRCKPDLCYDEVG